MQRFRTRKENDLTTLQLRLARPARLEPPARLAQARLPPVGGGAAADHHPPQQGHRGHQAGGQHDSRDLLKIKTRVSFKIKEIT